MAPKVAYLNSEFYMKKGQLLLTEKSQKFRELAERRTNNAIDVILRIGKLSNRQLYEYAEGDVKKIMKALRDAVSEVEERFSSPHGRGRRKFTL
jgi:hypothetical protein